MTYHLRLDFILSVCAIILVAMGFVGIPADDAAQAEDHSMSSMTVNYQVNGTSRIEGGMYLTMLGFCYRLTTAVTPKSGDPYSIEASSCQEWGDTSGGCDSGVGEICNNQHWGPVLAMAVQSSLGLVIFKFLIAFIRCCTEVARARRAGDGARARNCCLSSSNSLASASLTVLLLGVLLVYGTQCYVGDDAKAFVVAYPALKMLASASSFDPSFGPAFFTLASAAFISAASTFTSILADRAARASNELSLPLNR